MGAISREVSAVEQSRKYRLISAAKEREKARPEPGLVHRNDSKYGDGGYRGREIDRQLYICLTLGCIQNFQKDFDFHERSILTILHSVEEKCIQFCMLFSFSFLSNHVH